MSMAPHWKANVAVSSFWMSVKVFPAMKLLDIFDKYIATQPISLKVFPRIFRFVMVPMLAIAHHRLSKIQLSMMQLSAPSNWIAASNPSVFVPVKL